jgi:hypothetical protein
MRGGEVASVLAVALRNNRKPPSKFQAHEVNMGKEASSAPAQRGGANQVTVFPEAEEADHRPFAV